MAIFKNNLPGCAASGCSCSGGSTTPTPGFETCCPANAMPATLSVTFTFGGGFNAATYFNQIINTTVTYFGTRPAYALGAGNRYFSPTYTDGFGNTCYLTFSCSLGALIMGFSDFPSFAPTSCGSIGISSCSPFLATGIVGGASSGGNATSPTCISDSTGSGNVAGFFGTHVGDNITLS